MAQSDSVGPFVTLLGECVKQWKDDECVSSALVSIARSDDAAAEKATQKDRVMSVGKRARRVCLGCGKRFPEGALARHWLKNIECLLLSGE